jgi:hypothetical protein
VRILLGVLFRWRFQPFRRSQANRQLHRFNQRRIIRISLLSVKPPVVQGRGFFLVDLGFDRPAADSLMRDAAWRIAINIAKLPELLRSHKREGTRERQ